ncbi:MAG: hypothetical protein F6K16_15720 [Symploca sp. SIO2B6]|nr:hypothetical protein [Symploca sp. SIO2B6]
MLNPSDNHLDQQNRLQPLKQLINRHPIAFWSGLWAFLVLVGSVAAIGLIKPGPIEKPIIKEASKSTPPFTAIRQSETKGDLSVSLLGTLTLGCAGVSLLMIQALKQSSQRRKNSAEFKQTPTKHKPKKNREQQSTLGIPRQIQIREKRKSYSRVTENLPLVSPLPLHSVPPYGSKASPPVQKQRLGFSKKRSPVPGKPQKASKQPAFETIVPTADKRLPQVTVLPPEPSYSLDVKEEKLVDLMDLRKRRSLTSIMRGD